MSSPTAPRRALPRSLLQEFNGTVKRPRATSSADQKIEALKGMIASPAKYYPFRRGEGGRIRVDLTPGARKKRRVVYKIKSEAGKSYTGKTGQPFPKRIYGHHYGINHPEKDAGKKELYEDIRRNPEHFFIGVQAEADAAGISLELLEKACIAANGSFERGYNKDTGGGGGTAAQAPAIPPRTPKLTKAQAKTPQKSYDVDWDVDGKIRVFVSPKSKKQRSVIYGFKNLETGKWLIGETSQTVVKRLSGYHYAFSHPFSDRGRMPLPEAVRLNPEGFKFYILQVVDGNLKVWEKAWIAAKGAFTDGYNQNRGGGGSS